METIEWHEEMSMGVVQFDRQHRQILDNINRLIASEENALRSEAFTSALTDLTRSIRAHFETEESMLETAGFPDLEEHKARHGELIARVARLNLETSLSNHSAVKELLGRFMECWVDHILDEDQEYQSTLARWV